MIEAASREGPNLKIRIEPWTLHDLRRTCASGMAALGIAPHIVEAVLNHKSGTIKGVAAVYNRHQYTGEAASAGSLGSSRERDRPWRQQGRAIPGEVAVDDCQRRA